MLVGIISKGCQKKWESLIKKKRNDAADTSIGRAYTKDIPFDYIIVVYAL